MNWRQPSLARRLVWLSVLCITDSLRLLPLKIDYLPIFTSCHYLHLFYNGYHMSTYSFSSTIPNPRIGNRRLVMLDVIPCARWCPSSNPTTVKFLAVFPPMYFNCKIHANTMRLTPQNTDRPERKFDRQTGPPALAAESRKTGIFSHDWGNIPTSIDFMAPTAPVRGRAKAGPYTYEHDTQRDQAGSDNVIQLLKCIIIDIMLNILSN